MKSRLSVEEEGGMAPQVGLEPTTLRLTAEPLIDASHCKHKYLDVRESDYCGNWGDSGGTLVEVRQTFHPELVWCSYRQCCLWVDCRLQ
jgi:hypothetical protein